MSKELNIVEINTNATEANVVEMIQLDDLSLVLVGGGSGGAVILT